jgi:hypothetical protein
MIKKSRRVAARPRRLFIACFQERPDSAQIEVDGLNAVIILGFSIPSFLYEKAP